MPFVRHMRQVNILPLVLFFVALICLWIDFHVHAATLSNNNVLKSPIGGGGSGGGRERGRIPAEERRHQDINRYKEQRIQQFQESVLKAERSKQLEREYIKNITTFGSNDYMSLFDSSRSKSFGKNHFFNSNQPLLRGCGIRNKASGLIRSHRIILVVSVEYLPIFFNWMLFYLHLCPNRENIFTICINKETKKEMARYGITCSFSYDNPMNRNAQSTAAISKSKYQSQSPTATLGGRGGRGDANIDLEGLLPQSAALQSKGHENIWKARVSIAKQILDQNIDVLICDVDAFWLKNPYQSLEGAESDIIASRAKFPSLVYSKFGATVCMGFIYIRANQATQSLWNMFYKLMMVNDLSDDQEILNYLVFTRGHVLFNTTLAHLPPPTSPLSSPSKTSNSTLRFVMSHPRPLEFESSSRSDSGTFFFKKGRSSITLLPQNEFMRECLDYKQVLTATIAHCYAPKRGLTKEMFFRSFKTWIVASNSKSNIAKSSVDDLHFEPNAPNSSNINFENYLMSIYSKTLYEETMSYIKNTAILS